MNNQDEDAWVREFEKVEREQKQREGWELRATEFNPISITPFGDTYEIKDNNSEINDQ